jgi:hypothetical protein
MPYGRRVGSRRFLDVSTNYRDTIESPSFYTVVLNVVRAFE